MRKHWGRGLAAAALALGAHGAWAQSVTGCPAGQAMQSSDPSGRNITCVAIPDTAGLQQQITNETTARQTADNALTQQITSEAAARQAQDTSILNALGAETAARQATDSALAAETAARQAADTALDARIDALEGAGPSMPAGIVGTWSVSGTTNCLQSSTGFNLNTMSPIIPLPAPASTFVSQLGGTFLGTRTFRDGGTGRSGTGHSVGLSHTLSFPGTIHGTQIQMQPNGTTSVVPFGSVSVNPGGTSIAALDAEFTWEIQSDGTLLIDDGGTVAQPFIAPPSRVGFTATIENLPRFVGFISKDRRTIVMTHPGMDIETSVTRDPGGTVTNRTDRLCTRHRVLTRLD